jgi:hypothetical protein
MDAEPMLTSENIFMRIGKRRYEFEYQSGAQVLTLRAVDNHLIEAEEQQPTGLERRSNPNWGITARL